MSNLPINANIAEAEANGASYPVHLKWVPRVGEVIDLYSYLDAASNHPARRFYEVVQIKHEVHDIAEKVSQSHQGHHFVTVYVRPSQEPSFAE